MPESQPNLEFHGQLVVAVVLGRMAASMSGCKLVLPITPPVTAPEEGRKTRTQAQFCQFFALHHPSYCVEPWDQLNTIGRFDQFARKGFLDDLPTSQTIFPGDLAWGRRKANMRQTKKTQKGTFIFVRI